MKANVDTPKKESKVGPLKLAMIAYFLICGGPYGIERCVYAVGPFMAIILIVTIPVIVSLPLALVCSEMGSYYTQVGSTIVWAHDIVINMQKQSSPVNKHSYRFAKFVSLLNSNTLLIKGIVDNSLYPSLICDYLREFSSLFDETWLRVLIAVALMIVVAILNMFGLDTVGASQYVFALVVLSPTIIFTILGYINGKFDWSGMSPSNKPATMDYSLIFSIMIWQCTGFDQSTNLAGEIDRPQRSFPIAFSLVIVFEIFTFLLPVTSGVMNENDSAVWDDGVFSVISKMFGGCENGWLAIWLTISGCLSLLSILNVCVTCNAREVFCNAQLGNIPFCKWLGVLSRKDELFRCKQKQNIKVTQREIQMVGEVVNDMETTLDDEQLGDDEVEVPEPLQVPDQLQENGIIDEDAFDDLGLIPIRAVLVVCVIPIVLMVFPFSTLMVLDGFFIAIAMMIQMFLYVYAKHGQYGYVKNHSQVKMQNNSFQLKGGLTASIFMIILPVVVSCFMIYSEIKGFMYYIIIQLLLFAIYGIEVWIDYCKRHPREGLVQ